MPLTSIDIVNILVNPWVNSVPVGRRGGEYRGVTFADYYLRANIEFWNKACTRGKYYSYTGVYLHVFVFIYVYARHVLAVALASLP